MDFRDSPHEAAFRGEARAFLDAYAPARLPDYADQSVDQEQVLVQARGWQRTLFDHGWGSITWPLECGGRGLGPIEQIIWNQELTRVGFGESHFLQGLGLAGPTIIAHGTEAQKARFLEPILRADEIWCQLFSEPGAGSDLANLSTRAEKSGDEWIITGQKTWCSGGHYSDWGILLARSDFTLPKHRGITYFLVDMHAPGIEVRPLRQLDGTTHFNEVFLNEVRVPDANRLGPEGQGWQVTMTTLMHERMAIGGLERLLSIDSLLEHARANPQRVDDVMRDEIGRLYSWVKALELLNARVITKLGRGEIPDAESSMLKVAIARMLTKSGDIGLRLCGPEAMLRLGPWQNQFLTAPTLHVAGGTDEIQKNVCAERVLGLPREPRSDRDVPFDQLPKG
ncbi:MAG: acyl-CoA dehydrogenase [Deltaproteobacteria bacterium]|nr:MAG: acyl-CoA dehydrogenase [Deltaproteobacteria bacterium]TDJ08617.1 MAG: acyl-CoA dehydrogenase [Deltaproteobacteria bacterium]